VRGPKETLPLVMAIIAAATHGAREAKPGVRSALLAVGARGAEFAGWLYRDSALPQLSSFWHDRAAEWAQIAGDQALQGYVLLKRSQLAWDDRDAPRMLMLAQAVQDGPGTLPNRVRAEAAQQEARGHAMVSGDRGLAEAKLETARALLAAEPLGRAADGASLAAHYGAPLLAMQTSICYREAGQPARAAGIYEENLTANAFSRRDYGYFRALAGSALAAAGRPDEAAVAGREGLRIAVAAGSARTLRELGRLLEELRPWPERSAVLPGRTAPG
jgi:tetratricopeptide (TPR) repeat protein